MNAQTAISPINRRQEIQWSEPALPSKLSILLDQKMAFTDLPIIGPVSADRLRTYVAACQPPAAGPAQVNRMITRIANNLPVPRGMTLGEGDERMATYRETLSRHALPDLLEAFDTILLKCRFFPTIAEIEEIIAPIRAKRMARTNRADMLIMKHNREWIAPVHDSDKIDVSELVAETLAAHPSKR